MALKKYGQVTGSSSTIGAFKSGCRVATSQSFNITVAVFQSYKIPALS
jgi:hypothetical protein